MKQDKPSQTALWIAKGMLYLEKTKAISNYLDPKATELYRQALKILEPRWLANINRPLYAKSFDWVEKITLPGLFNHFFLRKQIIKRWLLEAISQHFEQVIVLAAGFDPLVATLYSQYPQVNFVEIDHPATQQVKKKAFYQLHYAANNVHFISADLATTSLMGVLQNAAVIHPTSKTFIIVEGLTMYLTKEENLQNFRQLVEFFQNDLSIAFSFMKKRENGSIDYKETSILTKIWLRWQSEVFKWGSTIEDLDKAFLEKLNLKSIQVIAPKDEAHLYKALFKNEKIADGEIFCLAKRKEQVHE